VLRRWFNKSRAGEADVRPDPVADEWRQEATIQELESVLWRVGVLTAAAHELVEDLEDAEVPGKKLSPPPAVLSDARELVEVIDAHGRERELWPPPAVLSAAQLFGLSLAVYAIFFDRLSNVGLLIGALGLLFIRRVLSAQPPWYD